MLGWELPPIISGGLGVASEGIAVGLAKEGHIVDFLLPKKYKSHKAQSFKILDASGIVPNFDFWKLKTTEARVLRETEMGLRLVPYLHPEIFSIARKKQLIIEDTDESMLLKRVELTGGYHQNLDDEIAKYALLAMQVAGGKKYDIIHAHDWITFRAGRMASKIAKKPLYTHCHSTEYERNGIHAQQAIIEEERLGFEASKSIFCVSTMLKKTIVEKYKIPACKVIVVPNAINPENRDASKIVGDSKKVLFIGRFTDQKNPSTFIDIAKDLLNKGINATFEMIGDGYLRSDLERKVKQNNLCHRFTFTGFVNQAKVLKVLDSADLLITPSSAEPFGLVMLEAISKRVPVAAARGVGLAEFVPSLPQIASWDHYNFVRLAEHLLTDDQFADQVVKDCFSEASRLSWSRSAQLISAAYKS